MKLPWYIKEKKRLTKKGDIESYFSVNIFWVWMGLIESFFKKKIISNNVHQYHFRRGRKRSEYKLPI